MLFKFYSTKLLYPGLHSNVGHFFRERYTKAAFFSCSNSACRAKTGSHHGLAKQACEDVAILGCSLTHYRFSPSFPAPEPALRVLIRLLRYRGLFT